MTEAALLDPSPPRPLWLWTLADLALLLVGFFVLVQATDRHALARGLRQEFGGSAADNMNPDPIPLASAGVSFAAGSALPQSTSGLVAFATSALADPRVSLRVAGSVDGSTDDVDAATRSGQLLAIDRARAVTALLIARGAAANRVTLAAPGSGRRGVLVTMSFTGDPTVDRKKP